MKLIEINKKEFYDFSYSKEVNNFYQSKEWAEVKRHEGWHTYFLGLDNNGKLEAATMLVSKQIPIINKRIYYSPGGFIINYKDLDILRVFTQKITEFIKKRKGIFLKIEPYFSIKQLNNDGEYVQGGYNNEKCVDLLRSLGYLQVNTNTPYPNEIYEIELYDSIINNFETSTKDTILSNDNKAIYTKNVDKNEIDKAINIIKNSKNVIGLKNINYYDLYNIFKVTNSIDVKLAFMDIDKYLKNCDDKNRDEAKTLLYKYGHNIILGCVINIKYGDTVSTILTAINNNFDYLLPIYTLHYDSMLDAYKSGYKKYNIYGITDTNILNYLKKYNGHKKQLIGEFDLVFHPFLYKLYNKVVKDKSIF